jgi:hypothetical protein
VFDFLFGAITDTLASILPRPARIAIYTLSGLLLAGLFAWLALR